MVGGVRTVAMLKVSKMLDKLVLSSHYNNELRPDGNHSNLYYIISFILTRVLTRFQSCVIIVLQC